MYVGSFPLRSDFLPDLDGSSITVNGSERNPFQHPILYYLHLENDSMMKTGAATYVASRRRGTQLRGGETRSSRQTAIWNSQLLLGRLTVGVSLRLRASDPSTILIPESSLFPPYQYPG